MLALWLVAAPRAVQAQAKTDTSIDVQLFQAALGPKPFLTVDGAQILGNQQFTLSLVTNYQNRPFTVGVREASGVERTLDVVRDEITTELGGAYGIADRFQIGLVLPLHLAIKGDQVTSSAMASGKELSGMGLGDLRVEGKVHALTVTGPHEFLLSVAPGLSLPTGNDKKYQGDKSVTGRLRAVGEYRMDALRAAVMLGGLFRGTSQSFGAKVGSQLMYGAAAEYKVHRDVGLLAEFFGRSGLSDFAKFYEDANPAELDAGMRVTLPKSLTVALGGGIGFNRGVGSPKFRGFLAVAWSPDFRDRDHDGIPDAEDRCPDETEDRDGYKDDDGCAEPDNDVDGVPDAQDKCPTEAEDMDQFQDEDGCPEADNDGDGTPDLNDACPNAAEDGRGKRPTDGCPSSAEDSDGDGVPDGKDQCVDDPEDRDGFQDFDGCPDADNDEDSIPDQFDACPDQAEDMDNFEDADGCPEPDNDKDGILDKADRCPLQPETLNGNRDTDGCPDPGAEIVKLLGDRIDVKDKLTFGSPAKATLTAPSLAAVNLVGMVMQGHQEIATLRIDVSESAKELAQARADAIAAALSAKGVAMTRLKAVGAEGAAKVDFVVEARVERKKPAASSNE